MKYLFITGQLNAGGAERVLLDILRHFDYSRHEVDLCQIVGGGTLAEEIPTGVHRIPLWAHYTLGYKIALRLSLYFGVDFFIRKRMRDKLTREYDVAISFLEGTPLRFHAIGHPRAVRHVTWVHANLLDNPYERSQFRSEAEEIQAYAKMNRIICVSESAKSAFCDRFPDAKGRTSTIDNPIEVARVQRLASQGERQPCDIVVVGRLNETKGVDRAIEALGILLRRGVRLTLNIVGDGPQRKALEELTRRWRVESQVKFVGYATNPYSYMRSAKILLCPSRSESFCLVICEALALGVPVVATPTTGAKELLGQRYGLLTSHDSEGIANAVLSLLTDRNRMTQYRECGPERASKYDIGNMMNAIYQL